MVAERRQEINKRRSARADNLQIAHGDSISANIPQYHRETKLMQTSGCNWEWPMKFDYSSDWPVDVSSTTSPCQWKWYWTVKLYCRYIAGPCFRSTPRPLSGEICVNDVRELGIQAQ